jgi:hypothetical protein
MKKIFKIKLIIAACVILLNASCSELPFIQTPTDSMAPPAVTNVQVEALPGGAKITYDLPVDDSDISYVKAEYMNKGVKTVVRASIYNNFLLIEGLGDIEPISATIYLVDHSENVSPGTTINFTPLTPPYVAIFESVQLLADFGGVKIKWTNRTNTEIGITVLTEDSIGVMREIETRFSRDENGEVVFRGFEPKEYHFAVRLTDKWGNASGTKEALLIPYFEKSLDKLLFKEEALPGDNTSTNNNRPFKNLWDNSVSTLWVSAYGVGEWDLPHYVTLDLGIVAKLSRIKLWPRQNYMYGNMTWKKFEAWACKTYKPDMPESYWVGYPGKGDDAWKNDWELLGNYEVKRPSGAIEPVNVPTGEDLEAGQKGWDFIVPLEAATARYIRFVVKEIWTPAEGMHMAELEIWGDDNYVEK